MRRQRLLASDCELGVVQVCGCQTKVSRKSCTVDGGIDAFFVIESAVTGETNRVVMLVTCSSPTVALRGVRFHTIDVSCISVVLARSPWVARHQDKRAVSLVSVEYRRGGGHVSTVSDVKLSQDGSRCIVAFCTVTNCRCNVLFFPK